MSSTSTFSDIDGLNSIKTSTWNGNLFTRMERFYLECGKSFVFLIVLQPSKQAAYKHLAPICPPIRIEVKPKPIIIRSHAISRASCHYTCLLWVLDRRLLILIGLKLLDCLCELRSAKWLFWFYDNSLKIVYSEKSSNFTAYCNLLHVPLFTITKGFCYQTCQRQHQDLPL